MTYAELAASNVTLIRRIAHGPAERLQRAAVSGARVTRREVQAVQRRTMLGAGRAR